ncbi:MAG TPA: hypothetical protein VFE33_12110 [Thermoanaerobaculia bacterium]|nr:hypothetical protein [Thermoanaerobaculia bacterium]
MSTQPGAKFSLVVLSTLVIAALVGTFAFAEGTFAGPPPYDKKTEVTLKGSIQEVKKVQAPNGVEGTHLMLKDGKQVVEVFVGPSAFITRQGAAFGKDEAIEVIGSKLQVAGAPALLARQIKKGGKTFEFRDEQGSPLWARQ